MQILRPKADYRLIRLLANSIIRAPIDNYCYPIETGPHDFAEYDGAMALVNHDPSPADVFSKLFTRSHLDSLIDNPQLPTASGHETSSQVAFVKIHNSLKT